MNDKKYLSIYRNVKKKIISGEYKEGEKLPSKRIMADLSGCSVITVEKAYSMLCDEGYITSREKSGYFVCKLDVFVTSEKDYAKESFSLLDEEYCW